MAVAVAIAIGTLLPAVLVAEAVGMAVECTSVPRDGASEVRGLAAAVGAGFEAGAPYPPPGCQPERDVEAGAAFGGESDARNAEAEGVDIACHETTTPGGSTNDKLAPTRRRQSEETVGGWFDRAACVLYHVCVC